MIASVDDALKYLVEYLRNRPQARYPDYGYDVYIPNVIRAYAELHERVQADGHVIERRVSELWPCFCNAAWELCRRGILRPGVKGWREQSTDEGSGYSITPFGRTWLSEDSLDDFVPTEPERFAQMLQPFRDRFGEAYYQRAQEAIRCYGAHAYLACCALCGAAAESILLAVACAIKDEEEVLKRYISAGGRSKVEHIILGQAHKQVQQEFRGFTVLLKYWRDAAAHGRPASISDNEAYTSLALLLRFSNYVNDLWDELTQRRT